MSTVPGGIVPATLATAQAAPFTSAIARVRAGAHRSLWLPALGDTVVLLVLFLVLRWGRGMLSADGDAARHLTVGSYILDTGGIPREDVFSYTMSGAPFVPYEWLAEVASALSYRWAGLAGPVALHGIVIGLTFVVLLAQLRARGHAALLALGVTALAVGISSMHWIARPHAFTFLGAAVFAAVLDGWQGGRRSHRWLWLLPVSMILWANLHGGFLVGLVLLGIYGGADLLRWAAGPRAIVPAAARHLRELLLPALATLAATLLTPAGPGLLGHVTGYFGNRILVDRTAEYTSPNFHDPAYRLFLLTIVVLLATVAWSRRRPQLHEGLLALVFLGFALYSLRNIPLFGIVTAPLLAAQLASLPAVEGGAGRVVGQLGRWFAQRNAAIERIDRRAQPHVWTSLAVVGLVIAMGASWRSGSAALGIGFDETHLPVEAVSYLKTDVPVGHGFSVMHWGGYLLRELWPAQQVFIDGQTDFYGEQLFRDYLAVAELRAGWEDVLRRYDVGWILFQSDTPLVRTLAVDPGWRVTYRDDVATVLIRAQPAPL